MESLGQSWTVTYAVAIGKIELLGLNCLDLSGWNLLDDLCESRLGVLFAVRALGSFWIVFGCRDSFFVSELTPHNWWNTQQTRFRLGIHSVPHLADPSKARAASAWDR